MKKLLVVSGLVLAVFIAAISETSAQTIYSCYNKKSGAMRHVTGPGQCKKTETEISWNTTGTGPKGDKGDKGDPGLPGIGAILVYDANRQFLGLMVDSSWATGSGGPYVFVPSLSKFLIFGEVGQVYGERLFYESEDCSGIPYTDREVAILYSEIFRNDTKYYALDAQLPSYRYINSVKREERIGGQLVHVCRRICEVTIPCDGPKYYQVVPVKEVTLPFTAPVALPLEYESK